MKYRICIAVAALYVMTPLQSHSQNVEKFLQGLTTGNPDRDRAVHEAFERGYRRGRDDQAREDHEAFVR